ncbi:MAG: thioredoxin [Alistipes sp.]|nr:thioredoxin [Alistipes sp.]
MATINLTKGGFLRRVADYENNPREWKFLGSRPAVIDFYASWCGPCKMFSPVLDEIAEAYDGKVDIYKVNIESEEELATLFGVRSVPTLFFIPTQGNPQRTLGVMPKRQIEERLNDLLKS